MLEFIVGDMVVIPGCGVGAIEDIEVVDLGEETVRTYKIYVKATAMHMWIPVSIAASKGLRAPGDLKRLKVLFEAIRQTTAPAKRTNDAASAHRPPPGTLLLVSTGALFTSSSPSNR